MRARRLFPLLLGLLLVASTLAIAALGCLDLNPVPYDGGLLCQDDAGADGF